MTVTEVALPPAAVDAYADLIGAARLDRLRAAARDLAGMLGDRAVWNVNSTAKGGGVAEMLDRVVPLARGLGVRVGWQVVGGPPAFFTVTKRLCERLYGAPGDGGPLGASERACYEASAADQLPVVRGTVRPGDVVVLHDPQTAGLVPALADAGCAVVWRCHVGVDEPNDHTDDAWRFLRPYLERAHAAVFTLRRHAPEWLAARVPVHTVAPSLDPFSAKNRALSGEETRAVLTEAGLFDAGGGRLVRIEQDRPIDAERPLVAQISRWDRLKDMPGVLTSFARHVADRCPDADLLLAGPEVRGVADDPAAADAYAECLDIWRALPPKVRSRAHLATLAMDDPTDNALVVNAVQRHAAVMTQKSLAEGFGLTVTEAMWKAAPVVASAVGGIAAQLESGVEGLLVEPRDLAGFGEAVRSLLDDRATARRLGTAARERVSRDFLVDRHLLDWAAVITAAADARSPREGRTS